MSPPSCAMTLSLPGTFKEFIDAHGDMFGGAQGGRVAAQEGGLMDLGGMEKDYRNDGGFVPLGGEEKPTMFRQD